MSLLATRLDIDRVISKANASSRKRVLETIAETIASTNPDVSAAELFEGLLERERLGSTGIGAGVAIPHCRQAVADIEVCLLTTDNQVDYDAADGEDVDIFFALVVPDNENQAHLTALADLATVLAEEDNRKLLRACADRTSLYDQMRTMLAGLAS